MFASMLLCGLVLSVSGTLEEECNILMKLESLETRLHEQEISLLQQDARISEQAVRIAEKDNRIGNLEHSLSEKDTRIGNLEQSSTEKDIRIGDLVQNIAEKNTRIETLEQSISETETRMGVLEEKVTHIEQLETSLSKQETDISELGTTVNATLNELETKLANVRQQIRPAQAVGFGAWFPMESSTHQQMTFRNVLVNEGGGFNASTGVFTCPVAGLYYLSVVLIKRKNYDGHAGCDITKNGNMFIQAYNEPGHEPRTGEYTSVAAAYTRLSVGDTIMLVRCNPSITSSFGSYSTFSGFMVTPDG